MVRKEGASPPAARSQRYPAVFWQLLTRRLSQIILPACWCEAVAGLGAVAVAQLGCVSPGMLFPLAHASLNNSVCSKMFCGPNPLTLGLATTAKSQVSPPVFPGGLQPFLRAGVALLLGNINPSGLSIRLFKFSGSCELQDAFLSWILSACLHGFAFTLLLLL